MLCVINVIVALSECGRTVGKAAPCRLVVQATVTGRRPTADTFVVSMEHVEAKAALLACSPHTDALTSPCRADDSSTAQTVYASAT